MRSFYLFLSIWTLIFTSRAEINFAEIVPLIPACALDCIVTGLSQSPAALADPKLTCTNVTLQASLASCVQGACNFTGQVSVGRLNEQLCEGVPKDSSRAWALIITGLVSIPLALFAVGLRTWSRLSIAKRLGFDDWLILVAGMTLVGLFVMNMYNCLVNGFGRHFWEIDVSRIEELLQLFFAAELLYILVITLVKISILVFYLRVFPARWFRLANYITLAVVITSGIAISAAIVFQCSPISGAWNRLLNARCVNLNMLAFATGGIAVALDVFILILPIPELINLQMNRKKKAHLLFMFSLGSFACITSIVRLQYLVGFATSTDQSWDNALPAIWSLLEICVAITCACLPAMRALLTRWLPRIFGVDSTVRSRSNWSANNQKIPSLTHSHLTAGNTAPSSSGTVSGFGARSKRGIATPERELLDDVERSGDNKIQTRVWVDERAVDMSRDVKETPRHQPLTANPHTQVISRSQTNDSISGSQTSSSSSIFALEGPRRLDSNSDLQRNGIGFARGSGIGFDISLEDLSPGAKTRNTNSLSIQIPTSRLGKANRVLVETETTQRFSTVQGRVSEEGINRGRRREREEDISVTPVQEKIVTNLNNAFGKP